jgi:sterol desaturase/sphingolipid hydroxylase (fatty acid hydroxylase superfamily)
MLESVAHYFENIPSAHRSIIIVAGLLFFWILEGAVPLFKFQYHKLKHAGTNLVFTGTTIIVNLLFAILILKASDWTVANTFGLLHVFDLPLWGMLIAGLLLFDLIGAYAIHWIQHKVKFMWRFHMVHHADTYIDVTSANRHHPGESIFRAAFTLLAVIITGAPIWLVMIYQSTSVLLSQFNHANFRFPLWLDRAISWIIVSPNMHKVHHHFVRPQTDSNYGNIFSIWDRLFGTFNYTPVEQLKYGLDVLDDKTDTDLKYQFKIPFNKEIKTDY